MIIVSQDKTEIINFDNVNTLRAAETGFILSYENTYKAEYDCSNILGKYKTEERAKKVLQEILDRYEYMQRNLMDSNDTSPFDEVSIYRMPKE